MINMNSNEYKGTASISNTIDPTFTLETLQKLTIHTYKQLELPEYKKSWLEKLMNKLGWYKQTTVYIIDK